MALAGHPEVLLGRRSECDTLDRLLDATRRGDSRTLVLHGEPGVGKTALLRYLVQRASDCRVVRAGGVQSEMEIAFAGLHQLCAPLLERLDALPGPQRDALRTTFGISAGEPPDRFLVALAVLGLLSNAAEERPLVCVVDDAQWLDQASEQALTFVARRLLAEPIALIFARRDLGEPTGLPELAVSGLRPVDARALLASVASGPLDSHVRDRIVSETRGIPLALLELPRGMTPAELAGGFGLPDARGVQGRIKESFGRRVQALPADSQRLLLLAAAEPVGDPVLVWSAAERLEIPVEAAGPAAAAHLLELSHRVRFPHPLVRSVIYGAAAEEERQAVHRALAEVTDRARDPDRRAWHRACATAGHDEEVAVELERSASRAHARGGVAAEAAFLAQAAELTPDPARRVERLLVAADAKRHAGAFEPALSLLALAETGPLEPLQGIRIALLQAQIAFAVNRGRDAPELLLRAAIELEPLDVRAARETYLDALFAALFVDRLAATAGPLDVAARARAGPPAATPPTVADQLLDGLTALVTDTYAAAAPTLQRALRAFRDSALPADVWRRWVPHAAHTALLLWDFDSWQAITEQQVQTTRADGALIALPISLSARIAVHVFAGELAAATVLVEEVETVAEITGSRVPAYGAVSVAAWRGTEWGGAELIDPAANDALVRGEGLEVTIAQWASAVLYNGLGRHERAQSAAERASEEPPHLRRAVQGISNWALIELVEAAVRNGDVDRAAGALTRLSEQARASGTDWALGIEARSRALLTDDEADYREAIERLSRSGVGAFEARTRLNYGEWLRRVRRRADARRELRTAHEQFVAMGLAAFADRAARELRAAGEATGAPGIQVAGILTAQEAQVARWASDGLSNADIGARLFLSPRTVQYHLRKVFSKLDISSRNQLQAALHRDASAGPEPT